MSVHQSKSFGSERPFRAHIVAGHGMGKEVRDLRDDVDEGFQNNEARASFPHLDWTASAFLAAGGDVTLKGRNLLQGQTFDVLSFGIGTAKLDLAVLKPGDSGFRAKVVQGVGALAVTFTGGLLTVTLAAAGSTSNAVAAAINALAACIGVIFAAGNGAGNMLVAAETAFAGGAGLYAGNKIWIAGVEALPKHQAVAWSETQIVVTTPALVGPVATDKVNVMVSVDGICSESLSGVLA